MPPGFHCLHDVAYGQGTSPSDNVVDIVAIHDIHEDSSEAWTDPESGVNWLRDLLPEHIQVARVVAYGYDASVSSLFASDGPENIQRMAECLVQELRANRQFAGTLRRPIIFVCHGLGGVLVKKSLIYSSTRTAPKVAHLWDQYISTFAILFFGTPHGGTAKSNWLTLEKLSHPAQRPIFHPPNHLREAGEGDPQVPQSVDSDFAPLVKQFHMFFFWEELPTSLGDRSDFIVDSKSAAPKLDNTETAGIHATHSRMVKFNSRESSDYRTVIAALATYCEKAPGTISHRWSQAELALKQLRAGEAWELGGFGFDVHLERPFRHRDIAVHRHFYPPQETTFNFIGREDMFRTLHRALFPGGYPASAPGRKSFVVFGMGGSGKTQFCSKFAQDYKHLYAAVFTIHAASKETIKDSFCRIGQLAELEPTENAGKHFLSQLSDPWLLIIDNADDPSLDLRGLFPLGDTAHILVTTRNPHFRQEGTLGSLELKGLREEEALQLLLTKADIPRPWDVSTREAGNMITKTLGYLALALIQAGNCIYRRICNLGEYLNLHSEARNTLHHKRTSAEFQDEEDDIVKVVYSTFDVSLEFLLKKQTVKSQDASDLLKIISFFHFEYISVEIFSRAVTNRRKTLGNSPTVSLASSLFNRLLKRLEPPKILPRFLRDEHGKLDKYRINWAIGELQSLSLVSFDGRYISLHPLIHAWARDTLSDSERKVWKSIALNTLMESLSLPPESSSEADGDFHRDVLPHLEACLSENGSPISKSFSTLGKFQMQVAKLCQPTMLLIIRDHVRNDAKCGWVFAERGQFEKAMVHLQMVKDITIQTLGKDDERTMTAMLGLAGVYWGLGRLDEAIDLQRSVVDTRSRLYGPLNEQTLQARDHLGRSYWLHGQYREALELQEVTAERMKATIGANHSQTLAALDNLGVTLGAWHRYEESLEVHREVLAARKKSLGETHLDTLTTKANLAMALLDLRHLHEAKSTMTEVYEQRQKQLGKEHPWTLWALCYLAKVLVEMGFLQEAEEMLVWGIEAGVRSLSEDHLGVLMGRGELARVYARQGRLEEAEKLSVKTIKSIETSRGKAHPDCVFGLWKLAQLFMLKGNRAEAIQACQRGLERADMRITRTHPLGKQLEEMLNSLQNASSDASDLAKLAPSGTHSSAPSTAVSIQKADDKPASRSWKARVLNTPRTATW